MVVQDEINIQGKSINQKPNSTICIFDTVGLHLLNSHILEPYSFKYIGLDLSHLSDINEIIIAPFKSYLNQYF